MQSLICLGLALQQQFFSCSCFCLCWCSTILQLWVHWSESFDFRFLREEHLHLHEKEKKKTFMHPIHSFSPPLSPFFQSSPSFFLPPSSTTGWCRLIGDDTETCHVLLCSLLCIIKTRATLHLHCSGRQMRARARDTGGEIRERKRERERERGERVFCYFSS